MESCSGKVTDFMKSVLKYPGSKNRIADWILSFVPEHDVYLEPFFGSGSVLFNKERSHIETVNDLNHDVVNFFKMIRKAPDQLAALINFTPFSREEYNRSFVKTECNELEKARLFCVQCWQGFGASNMYKNGFKSGQQKSSPNPAKAWDELPFIVIEAAQRLKEVQIECLPAIELIKRYDTSDVFIYADPPYLKGCRKGYLYKYEMSDQEHVELLETLLCHPGQVLISGYDNDLYNSILEGWHKEQKSTLAEGGNKRIETLWMNYDPFNQLSLF